MQQNTDLNQLSRKKLQALAKSLGITANAKSAIIIEQIQKLQEADTGENQPVLEEAVEVTDVASDNQPVLDEAVEVAGVASENQPVLNEAVEVADVAQEEPSIEMRFALDFLRSLARRELVSLAKEHAIRANLKSEKLVEALSCLAVDTPDVTDANAAVEEGRDELEAENLRVEVEAENLRIEVEAENLRVEVEAKNHRVEVEAENLRVAEIEIAVVVASNEAEVPAENPGSEMTNEVNDVADARLCELQLLKRSELVRLAKEKNIKANLKSAEMIEKILQLESQVVEAAHESEHSPATPSAFSGLIESAKRYSVGSVQHGSDDCTQQILDISHDDSVVSEHAQKTPRRSGKKSSRRSSTTSVPDNFVVSVPGTPQNEGKNALLPIVAVKCRDSFTPRASLGSVDRTFTALLPEKVRTYLVPEVKVLVPEVEVLVPEVKVVIPEVVKDEIECHVATVEPSRLSSSSYRGSFGKMDMSIENVEYEQKSEPVNLVTTEPFEKEEVNENYRSSLLNIENVNYEPTPPHMNERSAGQQQKTAYQLEEEKPADVVADVAADKLNQDPSATSDESFSSDEDDYMSFSEPSFDDVTRSNTKSNTSLKPDPKHLRAEVDAESEVSSYGDCLPELSVLHMSNTFLPRQNTPTGSIKQVSGKRMPQTDRKPKVKAVIKKKRVSFGVNQIRLFSKSQSLNDLVTDRRNDVSEVLQAPVFSQLIRGPEEANGVAQTVARDPPISLASPVVLSDQGIEAPMTSQPSRGPREVKFTPAVQDNKPPTALIKPRVLTPAKAAPVAAQLSTKKPRVPTPAKAASPLHRTQPSKVPISTTASQKKPVFDLQASLQRPLTWKVKKGPLPPAEVAKKLVF